MTTRRAVVAIHPPLYLQSLYSIQPPLGLPYGVVCEEKREIHAKRRSRSLGGRGGASPSIDHVDDEVRATAKVLPSRRLTFSYGISPLLFLLAGSL